MPVALKFGPYRKVQWDAIWQAPFAASQYFRKNGGAFLSVDTSGNQIGAITATAGLSGWGMFGSEVLSRQVVCTIRNEVDPKVPKIETKNAQGSLKPTPETRSVRPPVCECLLLLAVCYIAVLVY